MSEMFSSRLRHRVTLQEETRTSDGQGGYVRSWSDLCGLWAEITPIYSTDKQRESVVGEQLQDMVTHKITLRYRAGITARQRIVFNGRALYIRSVINRDEANIKLELLVEEGTL